MSDRVTRFKSQKIYSIDKVRNLFTPATPTVWFCAGRSCLDQALDAAVGATRPRKGAPEGLSIEITGPVTSALSKSKLCELIISDLLAFLAPHIQNPVAANAWIEDRSFRAIIFFCLVNKEKNKHAETISVNKAIDAFQPAQNGFGKFLEERFFIYHSLEPRLKLLQKELAALKSDKLQMEKRILVMEDENTALRDFIDHFAVEFLNEKFLRSFRCRPNLPAA